MKNKHLLKLQSIVRSIIYEYVLNVIAILQMVELAFRLEYYDTNLT